MKKTNITIKDIAEQACVSKATVSRVLNNSDAVESNTKERVLEIIKKNNYTPSTTARSLSKQVTQTIGVIIPEIDNSFFGEMLRGIIEVTDKNDLTLIICNSDDDPAKDIKALEMLKGHRIRGLIYDPATDYASEKENKIVTRKLNELGAPIVVVDRNIGLKHDTIYFDDYKAIYSATKLLINEGHEKIAIINATQDNVLARERQQGYLDALKDGELSLEEQCIFLGDYSVEYGYEAGKQIVNLESQPTAVVTCNNQTSKGFFKAIYEAGREIPRDYTNIALDKMDMLNILGIPYNHIERDSYEMGKKAMELLIKRFAFPDMEQQNHIMKAPIIRQTF